MMARTSCLYANRLLVPVLGWTLILAQATRAPTPAATLVQKSVSVTIQPEGSFHRRTSLRVRLESAKDLKRWAVYPIYLDENRELGEVSAFSVQPNGKRSKVRRKDRDTVEHSGSNMHSSARYHILEFSDLRVGSELDIDYTVEVKPYYPSDSIVLVGDEAIERLEIDVRGGGDAWRFRIDGPAEGFEVEDRLGGVRITASDLPEVDAPDYSPDGSVLYPRLRMAWGREGSWREVGAWYTELLDTVPRGGDPVRAQARELVAGLEDPRQRLEALLDFARRGVRYVAVEVGIGGYRPSTPEEVLTRRWGDCKDKSLLLIDLLREAEIDAYPALILADDDQRLDVEFPTPHQFNHLIVAVPSSAVDYGVDDPVGDGYFFVDPTQKRGTAGWLHPADQDQDVLVVREGSGSLARTPVRSSEEHRQLTTTLRVLPEGHAVGGAGLELKGLLATGFIAQMASAAPERMDEDARAIFSRLLPGAVVKGLGWSEDEGSDVPTLDMSASVTVEGLVDGLDGTGSRPSFKLVGFRMFPESRLLDDRQVPLVLRPQSMGTTWNLVLPEGWCLPKEQKQHVENEVGAFSQSITADPESNRVTVKRHVELRRRWIEPEFFPALKELTLAEHRAGRRRVRLACE